MELVEIRQELEKMAKRLAAFRGLFDLPTKGETNCRIRRENDGRRILG